MKKYYLSTVGVLFAITKPKAQNIIHNASFEDVDSNEASYRPIPMPGFKTNSNVFFKHQL